MNRNPKQLANLMIAALAVGLFFAPGPRSFADPTDTQTNLVQSTESMQPDPADPALKRQEFLKNLKDQLHSEQSDYLGVKHNVKDTETKLIDIQETRTTLQTQLSILTRQIDETASIIQNVQLQIQEKEAHITMLQNEIKIKNLEIENQKKMVSEYLKVLYEQENSVRDTADGQNDINIAKMLLSDKTPEESLRELRYFGVLEETGRRIFDKLDQLLKEQELQQLQSENSRNKLEMLDRQMEEQQTQLKIQQQAKNQLLLETKGEEDIYQKLLEESELQEDQVLEDINSLRTNLKFIENKIAQLGDKFNPDDYASIFSRETTDVYRYIKEHAEAGFYPRWPVSPSRGISAYFHDESYRKAMGVAHQAIDIRVPQGTPILAPADGVVYKVRDNGFGYSYIILAHGGGFMTVYGHVSEIRVVAGEKILEGQVIGLSGATPGTKGAGLMTTGAHLHFEVLKGGKHVDPLDYLPLSYLPLTTLPSKYLSRVTGEAAGVSRTAPDDSGVAEDSTVESAEL